MKRTNDMKDASLPELAFRWKRGVAGGILRMLDIIYASRASARRHRRDPTIIAAASVWRLLK